jgi:hypothetical protein
MWNVSVRTPITNQRGRARRDGGRGKRAEGIIMSAPVPSSEKRCVFYPLPFIGFIFTLTVQTFATGKNRPFFRNSEPAVSYLFPLLNIIDLLHYRIDIFSKFGDAQGMSTPFLRAERLKLGAIKAVEVAFDRTPGGIVEQDAG